MSSLTIPFQSDLSGASSSTAVAAGTVAAGVAADTLGSGTLVAAGCS